MYTVPAGLAQMGFRFYERADGTAFAVRRWQGQGAIEERLVAFDASGKVLFRHALAPHLLAWNDRPGGRTWYGALVVPVPLVGAARLGLDLANEYLRTGDASTYPEAFAKACREALPAGVVLVVVSAALAVLAYRRQRKYHLPWAGVWAVFVFLGGIPGFLACRFHRNWATCEACPACSQVVPRDRAACARCGIEFPAPAPKGIEVYEMLTSCVQLRKALTPGPSPKRERGDFVTQTTPSRTARQTRWP